MNRERMVKLLLAVAEIPDEEFDMGTWHEETQCGGTVGCAAYAYVRKFPNEGLESPVDSAPLLKTAKGTVYGHQATARHFDLDEDTEWGIFSYLVYPERPITKEHVLQRIAEELAKPVKPDKESVIRAVSEALGKL